MDCAFDEVAFDAVAFDLCISPTQEPVTSFRKSVRVPLDVDVEKILRQRREEDEILLL